MADIVQSLFGLTPEAYQQNQADQASRMALNFAQLTPMQQAQYGIARGAYQLGGALGGALGGQDPMLQLISNRQAIARQIDPNDLETYKAGILKLRDANDPVGAMQLTQVLQERLKTAADIGRLEAAAQASRAAANRDRLPAEAIQRAQRRAQLTMLLSDPGLTGEQRGAFEAEARALMSKEELEAEEAARQTRAFTGGVPAQPAMAQPMAVQPAAPAAEPAAAQPAAAQPAAPTTDIQSQLQQKFQQLEFALQFPSSPQAKARADVLRKEIEDLQIRGRQVSETQQLQDRARQDALAQNLVPGTPEFTASVNRYIAAGAPEAVRAERQNTEYRTWRDKNLDIFQAPSPSLSLEQQLEVRQTALSRVTQQPTAESIAGKSDQEFLKNEIAALRERIKEGRQASEERNSLSSSMFNGRRFSELTPAEKERVNARILREKKEEGQSRATRLTVIQEKGINENKVKLAGDVETGALSSPDRITLARSMMSLLPRAFTGFGADVKLSAARVAEAFGIPVTGTTESQIIDQILGQMTIGAAGQLKGALSDKDREFLKQTIGTRGLTRNTLQFVAERIERNARVDAELNSVVNAWQSQGKSLNNFNFVDAKRDAEKKIDAEIARYKQLKAKQEGGG